VTERRRIQQEVSESRQRLREMAARGEPCAKRAQEHCAEVHDELGQVLTALRMDLTFMDMRHGAQVPELKDKIANAWPGGPRLQGVRNVAANLRPDRAGHGAGPAIEWVCSEFTRRAGIPASFTVLRSRSTCPRTGHRPVPHRAGIADQHHRYASQPVQVSLQTQQDELSLEVPTTVRASTRCRSGTPLIRPAGMEERALALAAGLTSAVNRPGTRVRVCALAAGQPVAGAHMITLLLADDHAIVRSG